MNLETGGRLVDHLLLPLDDIHCPWQCSAVDKLENVEKRGKSMEALVEAFSKRLPEDHRLCYERALEKIK